MGLATSTIRLMYLNASRLDLEYKIQLISESKMNLGETVNDLMNVGTDLSPDSPVVKRLEQRRERLYLLEKKLDQQMLMYQNRLKMIEAEIESCQKMIDKNIEKAFKY